MAADWVSALADSRLSDQRATSAITRDCDPQGRTRCTLQCRAQEESSRAISYLLLQAFVEATGSSTRAAEQHGLLPRGIEIRLPPAEEAAAGGPGGGASGDDEQHEEARGDAECSPPLRVQFTATNPAAEERVEEAARLFEASMGKCRLPAGSLIIPSVCC